MGIARSHVVSFWLLIKSASLKSTSFFIFCEGVIYRVSQFNFHGLVTLFFPYPYHDEVHIYFPVDCGTIWIESSSSTSCRQFYNLFALRHLPKHAVCAGFPGEPDNKGFILDMLSYRRIERRLFPGSSQKEKRETQRKQFRLNVVSTTTMLPEPTHLEEDREKEGLSVEFGTSVREMMARPKTLMQKVPMSLKERQLLSAHSPASFRDTAIRTAHLLTTTTYKDYCMNPKKINGDISLMKCLQFMLLHDPLALGNIDEYGLAEGEVTTFLSL